MKTISRGAYIALAIAGFLAVAGGWAALAGFVIGPAVGPAAGVLIAMFGGFIVGSVYTNLALYLYLERY